MLLRILVALGIIVSGLVAIGLAASGRFLPHDTAFLGMTASEVLIVADSVAIPAASLAKPQNENASEDCLRR